MPGSAEARSRGVTVGGPFASLELLFRLSKPFVLLYFVVHICLFAWKGWFVCCVGWGGGKGKGWARMGEDGRG